MKGCIRFSNGDVIWFCEDNYEEIVKQLPDHQKEQLRTLLLQRLGPKTDNEFGVEPDVYSCWYDSIHRDDIIMGGGSSNSDGSKINKKGGKKYSLKSWQDKGDSDRNLCWLRNEGFKKRWDKDLGYKYLKSVGLFQIEVPIEWISNLSHDLFKVKVNTLLVEVDQ